VVPCGVWREGARFARASPALGNDVSGGLAKGWRCVVTGTEAIEWVISEVPFGSDDEGMFAIVRLQLRGESNDMKRTRR
jgi:hypothetical protein